MWNLQYIYIYILADFGICISVPLSDIKKNQIITIYIFCLERPTLPKVLLRNVGNIFGTVLNGCF